jgi:diamine N-acetyltransferase
MNHSVVSQRPSTIAIRRATAGDAEALAEFGARTFYETFAKDNTAEDMRLHLASAWAPGLQRTEILDETFDTLLACGPDGRLAAFAQLRTGHAPKGLETTQPVELLRFYVDKPWQGQGVAGLLMQAVQDQARARGARELWLGVWERNERAQAFYRKHGFRKVSTQVFVVGTDPQIDHVMIREL